MRKMQHFKVKVILVSLSLLIFAFAQAQQPVKKKISFAAGKSSATVSGSIKGYNSIDYLVTANGGQTMAVTLSTKHTATYFNVLPPGSNDEAIFNSSMETSNKYTGTLPSSGTYSIRVYMMRAAARRNETASFSLTVAVTGASSTGDAKVSGTNFNATGQIRGHVVPAAYASQTADFGVIRHGNGRADLHVNFAGGNKRILKYDQGIWSCDGAKARGVRNDRDEWEVIVNEKEVYIIPDAVIFGG